MSGLGIEAAVPVESGRGLGSGDNYEWLRDALDAVAALGQTFQTELGTGGSPEQVFAAARPALLRLADFNTVAFLNVDADGLGFELAGVDPPQAGETVLEEVARQTEDGTFGWALYQDRPVLVAGQRMGRWILLHVLATPSRISGMFVASLEEEVPFIPDLAQKVLSILLQNCAGVLESRGSLRGAGGPQPQPGSDHRAQDTGAPPVRGGRPGGQPGQERVPGQHEPRDPHAHQRHPGHDQPSPGDGPLR